MSDQHAVTAVLSSNPSTPNSVTCAHCGVPVWFTNGEWRHADYVVVCHRCPVDGRVLRRHQARLHGSRSWGGLWHCVEHASCSLCQHGDWCDRPCSAAEMAEAMSREPDPSTDVGYGPRAVND